MRLDFWEVEMTIGGVLIAVGSGLLLGLPPQWWPDMGRYWLGVGLCLGAEIFAPGVFLVVVAAFRRLSTESPTRIVKGWDAMWTRKRAGLAVSLGLLAVLVLPAFYVAAVPSEAASTNGGQPSSPPAGAGSVSVGHDINGNVCTSGATCIFPTSPPQPKPKVKTDPPPSINGNCNVIGTNSGTINCPTIQQTPSPTLQPIRSTETDNADGTHVTKVLAVVVAPFAPGHLILQVLANDLISVGVAPDVGPNGVAGIALYNETWGPTAWQATINGPSGRYLIIVTTKAKTPIRFGASFQ